MFDKYLIGRNAEHVPYAKTVIEKKAPTDESVRLLKELEEKALKKITEVFHVESAIVRGIVLKIEELHYERTTSYLCIFKINGERHTVRKNLEVWKMKYKGIEATPENIFAKTVSEYIFNEVMKGIKIEGLKNKYGKA